MKTSRLWIILGVLLTIVFTIFTINHLRSAAEHKQHMEVYKAYRFDSAGWLPFTYESADFSSQFSAKLPRDPWELEERNGQIKISAIGQLIGESNEYGVGSDIDVLESFHIAVTELGVEVEDPVETMRGALHGLDSRSVNKLVWSRPADHAGIPALDYYVEKSSLINQRGRYVVHDNALYYLFLNHRKELDVEEVERAFDYFVSNFEIK